MGLNSALVITLVNGHTMIQNVKVRVIGLHVCVCVYIIETRHHCDIICHNYSTEVDCGELLSPADGTVDLPDGTLFQATAVYSCDVGRRLLGDDSRMCLETGQWSGVEPDCIDDRE